MKTIEELYPIITLTLALMVLALLQERYLNTTANEPQQCVPREREYVAEYGYA